MTNEYVFNASSRRLNTLINALGLESYLEIGVRSGDTLFSVEAPSRTGVDPFFNFSLEEHKDNPGLCLHQTTSDVFFSELDSSTNYDITLIDGLHTCDQTYRDLLNVLSHSHPRSIIVIDDTIPSDVFSTMRDSSMCTQLRSKYGNGDDGRWHGDTYKIIPLIILFQPLYRIATIVDNGNPQTIMWLPNQRKFADANRQENAFEIVSALREFDYIKFLENISMYNPCSEADAISRVINTIC